MPRTSKILWVQQNYHLSTQNKPEKEESDKFVMAMKSVTSICYSELTQCSEEEHQIHIQLLLNVINLLSCSTNEVSE